MKTLQNLLIDTVRDNPLWDEFVRILDEQNQKDIIAPIKQLLAIRDVANLEDPELVKAAIRQQGLALTDEMININFEKLKQLHHVLPLYHETSGTPNYPKFIEFLLDRNIFVKPLYTADYINFYEKPLGETIENGGEWYATTHISLTIELDGLDNYFSLVVDKSDFAKLSKMGLSESALNILSGKSVMNHSDVNVKQAILETRVLEMFYKFAPLEEVIDQILFSVTLHSAIFFSGHIVNNHKDYMSLGGRKILSVDFPTTISVVGGTTKEFTALINWEGGAQSSIAALVSMDDGDIETFVEKYTPTSISFIDPEETNGINITLVAMGQSQSVLLQLYPQYYIPVPTSIVFNIAPKVPTDSWHTLVIDGLFETGQQRIKDLDSVQWESDNENVIFRNNTYILKNINESTTFAIGAEYVDQRGEIHNASTLVTVEPIVRPLAPDHLVIDVTEVVQGQNTQVSAEVVYNDGSTQSVTADWLAKSKSIKVGPTGILYSSVVYKDFAFRLLATATVMGITLEKEIMVDAIYPKIEIFELEIVGQDIMLAGDSQYLKCIAHWATESNITLFENNEATSAEIVKFSSEVNCLWKNIGTVDTSTGIEIDLSSKGKITVPNVLRNRFTHISASVSTEGGKVIETLKTISIKPRDIRIAYLDLIMQPSINEGSSALMRTVANWTDGTQTELKPDTPNVILEYSAVVADTGFASNYLKITEENKDILNYLGTVSGIAKVLAKVQYSHETPEGNELQLIEQDQLINIVPRIYLTTGMQIIAPESHLAPDNNWVLGEQGRMFITTIVTLEDGTTEEIKPSWTATTFVPEDDEEVYLDILSEDFTVEQMVVTLTNKTSLELYIEQTLPALGQYSEVITDEVTGELTISYRLYANDSSIDVPISSITDLNIIHNHSALFGYRDFKELSTFADVERVVSRTLIQSTKVLQHTEIKLQSSFFREEAEVNLTLLDRKVLPHDIILGYKLKGPMEFYANVPAVSYALYVNYDDRGAEYGVSNDWTLTILNKRKVLERLDWLKDLKDLDSLSVRQLDEMFPDSMIVDIDQNGYVYPKHNVSVEIKIEAEFDDGRTKFKDSLEVSMVYANADLKSIRIVGPNDILDVDDPLLISELLGNPVKAHVQYQAILERYDGTFELLERPSWTLKVNPTTPNKKPINMDVAIDTGKLYVAQQVEDLDLILVAEYEEQKENALEHVVSQIPIYVHATKMPTAIVINNVGLVTDDSKILVTAKLTHADGTETEISLADWSILDSPLGTNITKSGVLTIPKLEVNVPISIRVSHVVGSVTVAATYTFNVVAESSLESLSIAGHNNIRDDSSIQLEAILFRKLDVPEDYRDTPIVENICNVQECVTEKCAWTLETPRPDVKINNSGIITFKTMAKDTDITVLAQYEEFGKSIETWFIVHVKSSLPKFGIGLEGLNTSADIAALPFTVNSLKKGGSFTLTALEDEYAYFAHRSEIGLAVIAESEGKILHGGWQNPIPIEVEYENMSELWFLYRSDLPAFGTAAFAFYYRAEEIKEGDIIEPEPDPLVPEDLFISGLVSVGENTTVTYSLKVTYTDKSTITVPFETFESDNILFVTDALTGELVIGELAENVAVILSATYTENGVTLEANKTLNAVADVIVSSLEIVGRVTASENSSETYRFKAIMGDGTFKEVVPNSVGATVGTFQTNGEFTSPVLTEDTLTTLQATYIENGVTVSANFLVTLLNTINIPTGLVITGDLTLMEGNNSTQLIATATFEDGTSKDIADQLNWSVSSGQGATINSTGKVLSNYNVTQDELITFNANGAIAGTFLDEDYSLTVTNNTNKLTNVMVTGINTVVEDGTPIQLTAFANYEDLTAVDITNTATWSIISGELGGNIDGTGLFTPSISIEEDIRVVVRATFLDNGILKANTFKIDVTNVQVLPISLTIDGAITMPENTYGNYSALVLMSDGSTKSFSIGVDWSISGTDSTIDFNGRLSANSVSGNSVATLSATVIFAGIETTNTLDITILDSGIDPILLAINAPTELNERSTLQLTSTVAFDDNSEVDGTALTTWKIIAGSIAGTIDANGLFNALGTDVEIDVMVEAEYFTNLGVLVDTHSIKVLPIPLAPSDLVITGVTTLSEGNISEQLTATLTLNDATVQDVTDGGTWAIDSGQGATIDANGLITSDLNVTQERSVTVKFSMTSEGIDVYATYVVSITNDINYVVSLTIGGAISIAEDSGANTFTATANYEDGSVINITNSAIWSIVSGNTFADLVGNILTPVDITSDQTVVLEANYLENGVTVSDQHVINIRATLPVMTSLVITGTPLLTEGDSPILLTATVTYDDLSTIDVTGSSLWEIVSGTGGTLTANEFTPSLDVTGDQTIQVKSSYTANDFTIDGTFDITVQDATVEVVPTGMELIGPDTMESNSVVQYSFLVTYSDATTEAFVIANNGVTDNVDVGTMAADGTVTTYTVLVDTLLELQSQKLVDGVVLNAFKTITVKEQIVSPVSMEVAAVTTMDENTSTPYTLEVTYSDGSTAFVTNPDSSGASDGVLSFTEGFIHAGDVTADKLGIVYNIQKMVDGELLTANGTMDITVV